VLNQGRVVEQGPTKQVLQNPTHKYTMQLLGAVANPFTTARDGIPSTDRGRT
jgi:ABC-type dipeptide/oligopeptide/nickel transport system ATPase component